MGQSNHKILAKIKNNPKVLYRKYSTNIKYVMMVVCVLIITYFLPRQPRFRYEFEKSKTWQNKDLISPFSFAILKTTPQVAIDKKEALNNVLPIYNYDGDVFKDQIEVFLNEFDVKWKSDGFSENEKEKNKKEQEAIEEILMMRANGSKGLL